MKTETKWTVSNINNALPCGIWEFQDKNGDWHDFQVLDAGERLVFGGACNVGFLESGFIVKEENETLIETLGALAMDLESFYNDGAAYISRIVCNDRM